MRNAKAILGAGLMLVAGTAGAKGPALNWVAGDWCGDSDGRRIEEVWLPEAGGALLGMSRTLRDGKTVSFEFMRIVTAGNDAGLHVQPNGAAPTTFTILEAGEGWVRFGNDAHDFPNRIEYRREGEAMHAWIAGPGRDGKEMKISFDYRRCRG